MSRRCHATARAYVPNVTIAALYDEDDHPHPEPIEEQRVMCERAVHDPATNHLATLETSDGPITFEFPWRY